MTAADRGRRRLRFSLLLLAGWPGHLLAQEGELTSILLTVSEDAAIEDVDSRALEIYRIPLSYTVRDLENHSWGMRITFPVSFSSYRITALTELDEFIEGAEVASIIPGVELQVPVGQRWELKPFAEYGIGRSTSGNTEALFGTGIRTRGTYMPGRARLMLGGAAAYKEPSTSRTELDGYSRIELGVDGQWPLGSSVGRIRRGGIYGIARQFFDLVLERVDDRPIELKNQYELGVSVSTEPAPRLWKVEFPWIGLGYQFGDVTHGLRLYLAFPF